MYYDNKLGLPSTDIDKDGRSNIKTETETAHENHCTELENPLDSTYCCPPEISHENNFTEAVDYADMMSA